MMKKVLLLAGLLYAVVALPTLMFAQDWVSKMKDPTVNFYDVQKAFNKYQEKASREMLREKKKESKAKVNAANEEEESEVPGYFQYKRWEWFMAPRVSATGERPNPAKTWQESQRYRNQFSTLTGAGNWTFIGPSNTSNLAGAGRLNFVRMDPTNSNIIYVGSPAGGLWKSIDAGATWSTNTDWVSPVIGCTDIAIDPTNTNVMYLATGDGDAGDTYTVGLLKTTDGGNTWNTTGLSFFMANYRQMSKVLIDPSNTNTIIVATSGGIYRSTDGAATFTQVQAGGFKDMEFKPTDPTTVYACGTEFFKSTNNGQNWTKVTAGLPVATNVSRMAIAVTPANPSIVYLIAGLPQPNYGTEGFYKSTTSGTIFSKPSTPALGNQQWYDLAIAASPTNSQEVVIGGQTDFIRSTTGGTSWSQNGGFTHVDYHDILFVDATSYYVTSDGGLYYTNDNGSTWNDLNSNLAISEMYGFGQSSTTANLLIQGWQDNGTNIYDGTNWSPTLYGDGMLCFISWNNDNNMWGEQYGGVGVAGGSLHRSTNGGNSWNSASINTTEYGSWVTPWLEDPTSAGVLYAGLKNVWKSITGGAGWTKISNFTNTATINTLAVSGANNQVIWVAKAGELNKTNDGGATWSTITNVPSGTISGIACSNTDPNKAWITYSGFANVNKVFQTTDQGLTWTNLSASVPNIPVNCIAYVNNSANDGLYIGTDVGVFYKDNTLNVWQPFFNGLPNVVVSQLQIFYAGNKLRASTYGRGMWESGLYIAGTYPPSAAFGSDLKIACPGTAIQFTDYSAGQPSTWSWSFPGGSPSSSTQQNPLVSYNTPGTYPVTLIVTNVNGNDTVTYNNLISISSSPFNAPSTNGASLCAPGIANLSATGTGSGTLRWWDAPGGGNLVATGGTYSPSITTTTTYYVDEDFPAGAAATTGEFDNSIGAGAYFTANDIRGLYFDVLQPVVLNTVEVYPNSAGDRTIEVIDPQGNTFVDTTLYIPAGGGGSVTITLNFTLYPGTGYFIKCRGFVDLFRNTAGAAYPYTSTGINVTGSNAGASGYYYFFYNWQYNLITCNTARAACTATDTCSATGLSNVSGLSALEIYPNPSNGVFSLKFNTSVTDNYTVKVTNTLGQEVYEEKLNTFSGKYAKAIDISTFGKGVYMLSIVNSENKAVKRVMVY
jgi:PKD repeat protein/photosystem II stability/assembly factor-like uncharacterized protein